MADETPKVLLPGLLEQNPAPVAWDSQDRKKKIRDQVDRIMDVFSQVLPSNYVSQVTGPYYTIQFQAAAERIADFQITAQEIFADRAYDYLRPEFLFQLLGNLVFPNATDDGYPTLAGDLTYRRFLRRMVELLLEGATKNTIEEGLALLSDATFKVLEKGIEARLLGEGSAWGLDDTFSFEVDASYIDPETGLESFPPDPFVLQENVRLVLRALKPAHTLYDYRHLFTETFGDLFSGELTWEYTDWRYEDFRRYCVGAKRLAGTGGVTLSTRNLLRDTSRDFSNITVGVPLTITSGVNSIHAGGTEGTSASEDRRSYGRFRVVAILTFHGGDDATERAYTTSPTGLSGKATVSGSDITDSSQDWGGAVEGEVLTFTEGPNSGSYRLKTIRGSTGGPVGKIGVSGTSVRIAPSTLRLDRRMRYEATGQGYEIEVDRMGVQLPHSVVGEDVSAYFLL